MLDPKSVIDGPIPAVSALDVERFWSHQSQHSAESGISYSAKAISQLCGSETADPIAIWARTTLVSILSHEGLPENWSANEDLRRVIFQAAAVFPLPNGLQGLNPGEFIAKLPV